MTNEVKLRIQDRTIIISRIPNTRAGWAEAAKPAHLRGHDQLLDPMTSTHIIWKKWI